MSAQTMDQLATELNQEIAIAAPQAKVFQGLIDYMTHLNTGAGNEPMPMKLEQWPGGRWFRDLGDNTGHCWAHVQAIKPPALLEFYGPLFMSFAVANNVQFRVEPTETGAVVKLRHHIFGPIPDDYRQGVGQGWSAMFDDVKKALEG